MEPPLSAGHFLSSQLSGNTVSSPLTRTSPEFFHSGKEKANNQTAPNTEVGLYHFCPFRSRFSPTRRQEAYEADVRHRLQIAQSAFSSLSHLWADHRLSRTSKLRLYRVCVCSSLTHCCEAWTLNRTVMRSINVFNSRCLPLMTGDITERR